MKKIFISILLFLPLTYGNAQSVLTPQQQLEQAQKQLEEAKKAVEEAKKAAEEAKKRAAEEAAKKQAAEEAKKKAAEEAAKKQAAEAKAQAEKIQQQIKEAEAEAARLKAEAARLNAIANGEATAMPTTKQTPATSTATKNTEKPASKTSGWVIPTAVKKTEETKPATTAAGLKLKEDPKYLEGAVTTDENGKVVFEAEMEAPGKSAEQLYELLFDYMSGLTQDKEAIESRIALVNKDEHIIANLMDEWLVFSSSFISLDRSEFKYQLVAKIADNHLNLKLLRISYNYEEDRPTGFKAPAEKVITDKVALTKKKNDLAKIFGKFRKKTIDRKDQIFSEITALVKQ